MNALRGSMNTSEEFQILPRALGHMLNPSTRMWVIVALKTSPQKVNHSSCLEIWSLTPYP